MPQREFEVVLEEQVQSLTDAAIAQTKIQSFGDKPLLTDGLAICKIVGFQEGAPLLQFEIAGASYTYKAVANIGSLGRIEVGSFVCAGFDQNQMDRPIVLGELTCDNSKKLRTAGGTLIVDDDQITLKCGKASINLKSDGTVAIRGTNVASRASQTNRIRGGNVQIN